MVLTHGKLNRKLSWDLVQILLQSSCLGTCPNLSVFHSYRTPTNLCLSYKNKSHVSKYEPVEGDFSEVSFLEQVETWETFAADSGLEVITWMPVVKKVIGLKLHIVALIFKSFAPL